MNTSSVRFHSDGCSNILQFLSAITFSQLFHTNQTWLTPPPPLPKLLIYATAVLLSIITLICLMSLLSLKKLGGPSLAPKNSRALICNACSCLVYIPPVSIFFTLPPPQASKLGSVYIVVSTDTFFKLLVAVIILFWHQGSSFLEKSKTVILAGKTFVLL